MRWIRNSPVLCEVCGNARLSGFCCESHPPIAVLIPDALPNDTETAELSGGAGKVTEKLHRLRSSSRSERQKYDLLLLTDTEGIAAAVFVV